MPRRILLLITDLEIGGTPTVVRELATRLNDPARRRGRSRVPGEVGAGRGPVARRGRDGDGVRRRGPADFLGATKRLVRLIRERTVRHRLQLPHPRQRGRRGGVAVRCRGVRFIQSIQTTQPKPRWHWWLQSLIHGARRAGRRAVAVRGERCARLERRAGGEDARDPQRGRRRAVREPRIRRSTTRRCPVGFIGRLDPVKRLPDLLVAAVGLLARPRAAAHLRRRLGARRSSNGSIRHLRLSES